MYMHLLPPLTGHGDSSCGEDNSSEDCWESGSEASDGSLYLLTPEQETTRTQCLGVHQIGVVVTIQLGPVSQ